MNENLIEGAVTYELGICRGEGENTTKFMREVRKRDEWFGDIFYYFFSFSMESKSLGEG